eukprot:GHVU01127645.1.p1 GENE.GHVU01127645.1~~GHVU01127645.1.p1  ORF type:complete len:120 (+),score=7.30 GHVU01127645.1:321-680(+)
MLPSRSQAKVLLQRKSSRGIRSWEPTLLNDALEENKIKEFRVEDRRVVTIDSKGITTSMLIKDIDAAGLVNAYRINNHNGTPAFHRRSPRSPWRTSSCCIISGYNRELRLVGRAHVATN